MSAVRTRFDHTRFSRALRRLAQYSKKGGGELLEENARGWVKRAVDYTPPAQGKANPAARKRGEDAIRADLRRIMTPKPRSWLEYLEGVIGSNRFEANVLRRKDGTPYLIDYDVILWGRSALSPWHLERRRKSDGRVKQTNRDVTTGRKKTDGADMAYVPKDNFQWYERRAIARVGVLAAGFNAAASRLGTRGIPQWVRRHGTGRGDIDVRLGDARMRIVITNDVPYAGAVRGFQPRLQRALNEQARAMERRVDHYLQKAGKSAGFR